MRRLRKIFMLTMAIIGLPYFAYGVARTIEAIPTEAAWTATGASHGPWYHTPIGWLLIIAMVVAAIYAVLITILALFLAIRGRNVGLLLVAALLIASETMAIWNYRGSILWVVR